MAKTDLTIDITGKLKKSYSVKGKTNIIIIGNFEDSIKSKEASGTTLTITLNDDRKFKLTNIADTDTININFDDNSMSLQNFYGIDYTKDWTPKKGTTVTGTVFDDYMDLSETTYTPTSKKAKANNTGLTINGGKGNDTIIGTKYNDVISGGAGNNTVVYNTADTEEFGNDTIKFTKGENLVLDLTSMGLDEDDFRELLTHDSKNLFISLSDEEKVKLNNFYKSNGVGANGSVKVLLQVADPDEGIEEISVDLNEDVILSFGAYDANKKGAITGSRLGDYITGGEDVKSINGGAGNDHIIGGEGNQTLTGGAGADIFEFVKGDGVDIISDAKREDMIIIDDVESMMDLAFKKAGNNLEIFYAENVVEPTEENPFGLDENNKIVIKNYFKTKEINRIDTVMVDGEEYSLSEWYYITQGSGTVKGTEGRDILWGSAKADTLYGYDGDDDIYAAGGNDKLTGGKGDDMLWGGSGKNTFVFAEGDGEDHVWDADKDDVIQIDSDVAVACEKNGDNLIIKYANDSITLYDYYTTSEGNRVDTLKVKHGKKYNTVSIKDILPVEPVVDNVLSVNDGDVVNLASDTDYEAIKFVSIADPKYVNWSRSGDGLGDDLIVQCGSAKVTLTDYMKGGHNVQFFQTGPYTTNYDIPYHIGTDGDDTFDAQNLDESFFTKAGNDTINFNGEDFGNNEIYSDGTSDNVISLNFDNYSFTDDQFSISGDEGNGKYIRLAIDVNKKDAGGTHHGKINYDNYFDGDTPTVQISDKNEDIISVAKKTDNYINLSDEEHKDNNHVQFLFGSGKKTVISNTKTNYITASAYDHNMQLDYTYKGGQDKVNSRPNTNDEYKVENFNKDTRLVIADNDGVDTLNLGADADNIRLFFDVVLKEESFEEYTPSATVETAFVHADVFSSETLKSYYAGGSNKWISGVVSTSFGSHEGTQTTEYNIETVVANGETLNLDKWKDAVAKKVGKWFENWFNDKIDKGTSPADLPRNLSDAISEGLITNTQLTELLNLFNFKYSDIGGGVINPDSDGFFNLSNGDGASIIKTYTSANKIRFADSEIEDLTYTKDGNNLVIKYSDGEGDAEEDDDTVTIENFFTNTSRIDDIYFGEDELPTLSIKTSAIIGVELDRDAGFVKSDSGCTGYIVKVLANGTNSLTGLTTDDFVDFGEENTSYYQLNSAGMNVTCGVDKVIITDFDPQTPPVIRVAGEEDDLSEKELVVSGLSNFDGTSYGFGEYSIKGTTSADTLTGGAGEDTFVTYQGNDTVTGGAGADSFRFWTGHGVDTIVDAEYDDKIIIDYMSDASGASDGKTAEDVTAVINDDNKLEIRYSDNDKVIIDNYDPEDTENNIDTINVITADGVTELSISDLLDGEGGDDPSGDDYTDFTPDYSCDDPASDTNTYVINPTGYMSIKAEGNDLVFSWWDESDGDVERRLENYFTEGSVYKYISVNGEDPEILDEYCHIQIGTNAKENFTGMPDPEEMGPGTDDIIFAGGGDDKITGNGGTNYINAGSGNNKIYLSDNHWEEAYILNGGGSDTLIFPEGAEINASLNGDDLHISYYGTVFLDEPDDDGETTRYYDGSVVIENYSNGTSVQYAQIGDAEPIAIADFIDSHQTPTDENTLAILTNKNVDCSKDATNNLVFKYYDDDGNLVTETTTDEHKFVRIGYNGDPVSINNIQTGTDNIDTLNGNDGELIFAGGGNDNLTSGNSSDSLYLGSGNDTVTFGQHFGRDEIWSVGDSTNSDKLIFQNHSLVGRTLNFSYGETYHQDSDWNSILDTKDLQIHSGTSEKYGGMGRFGGDIIYHDYFSYNTPNITITDATGDTYALERYKTAQTLDWTNSRVNKAALLEIAQYTDSSVVSGNNPNKANYVYSMGGGRLDYTYQGGIDTVNSASGLESANDNYNIASFNSNTDLILSDAGGIGDTMQINASTNNIRLIFDVGADVDGQEYYNNVYWSGIKLVHTDNFSAATLSEYLKGGAELKGVTLNVNQEISDENTVYGNECGIEQVTTTDCETGIDMNAWKATITDNVKQWLDTYGVEDKDGYVTVSGTLNNTELTGDDLTTALNELYACYNVNGAALEEAPVIDKGGITAVSSSASENWAFGTGNNNLTLTSNIGADTITSLATKYNDKYTDTLNFTKMSFGDKLSIDINDKDVIFGDRTDMKNNSVTYTNFFDTEVYEEQIHNKTVVIDSTGEYEVINRYVESYHDFNYDNWTYERDKKYITLINNPNNRGGSIFSWTETNIVHVTGDGDMGYAYMGGHDEVVSHGASEDYYNFNGGGYNNGEVNITNVFDENTKWTIRDFGGEDELRLQTDIENVRLAFDCDKDGNVGNEISFVHNGVFGLDTLTSVTNNAINWTAGTIKVEAPTETGVFGIETVEYQSNPYGMATQIDVDSWIASVKSELAGWFTTHSEYSSVQDAFTNCKDETALQALYQCYNVQYSDVVS